MYKTHRTGTIRAYRRGYADAHLPWWSLPYHVMDQPALVAAWWRGRRHAMQQSVTAGEPEKFVNGRRRLAAPEPEGRA